MKLINCPNILGAFLDPIQIHQPRNKEQGDLLSGTLDPGAAYAHYLTLTSRVALLPVSLIKTLKDLIKILKRKKF